MVILEEKVGVKNIKAAINLVLCALTLYEYFWHPTVCYSSSRLRSFCNPCNHSFTELLIHALRHIAGTDSNHRLPAFATIEMDRGNARTAAHGAYLADKPGLSWRYMHLFDRSNCGVSLQRLIQGLR